MKKLIATCLLCLSAVVINVGATSILTIGVEDMPESMKKLR